MQTRKFTAEEKAQLLANLDIEVAHRTRQFEAALEDALAAFRLRAESHISRIPRPVRAVTMSVFAETYGGDVQACLRGLMREGVNEEEQGAREERKRKWVADADERVAKTARTMAATPKKKPGAGSSTGPGTAQRARLLAAAASKTPGTSRTMGHPPPSPSPRKPKPFTSPSKPSTAARRPPSSTTFNPTLPSRTPAYPRPPRKDESMLSVNGSPLVNPYELADPEEDAGEERGRAKSKEKLKQKRSTSIIVQRDPSFSFAPTHTRQPSAPSASLQPPSAATHSRSNSFTSNSSSIHPHPLPITPNQPLLPLPTATISLPTLDGHLLSFDALTTSPGALDALEGISESAKKAAREEMRRLVQDVVGKWKIG